MAASASAVASSALSSPFSALADGGRTLTAAVPQCVSIPQLPAASSLPTREARRPLAYCRKTARNMISMATGDAVAPTEALASADSVTIIKTSAEVTTETTTEVATELPEIVKTIQAAWDKVENKYAVSSLAFAGFVGLVGAAGAISAVDRLPLVPGLLEIVGIGYSGWFAYKNLLAKANRDALLAKIKSTYNEIIGSE